MLLLAPYGRSAATSSLQTSMVSSQTSVKLTTGFLKVSLQVPDSFQFTLTTFPNQCYKVNYICMLTMLQLLSLVQFKQVDSSYRQIAGPLLPVQCGNAVLKYTCSTKSLGVVIDSRLLWRDQVHEMCKSYCNQINMFKRIRHLPLKLLEDIYFKTIIPHVTFSISVWGSCSPTTFAEIDRLHFRAAKIIHSLLTNTME